MNANFRRDYSYKADNDFNGVKEGEFLRYLKYDRKTRSYLFLTGIYTNKKEKLIVVPFSKLPLARTTFKKRSRIDYYPTNQYQGDFGKIITTADQLELGKTYNFIGESMFGLPDKPLKVLSRGTFGFILEYGYCLQDAWINGDSLIDDNRLTARLAG